MIDLCWIRGPFNLGSDVAQLIFGDAELDNEIGDKGYGSGSTREKKAHKSHCGQKDKEKPLTTKKERGGERREKKANVKTNMVEALKGR